MLSILLISICFTLTQEEQLKLYTNITEEQYGNVPAIFRLDDYDTCLSLKEPTLYCYVSFRLTAAIEDEPSPTWKIIKELNSVPRNYRHDLLRHGICLPRTCSIVSTGDYSIGNGSPALRSGLSKCYTERYKYFGLKANVEKLHCENKQGESMAVNNIHYAYALFITTFLFLIFVGSVYDLFTKPPNEKETHIRGYATIFLQSFSLRKNLLHFLSTSQNDDDLSLFQGVRFIYVSYGILAHSFMLSLSVPVFNTKFAEDATLNPGNMFFVTGGMMYQTFFLMSGWMLSYRMFKVFGNDKIRFKDLIKLLVLRVLRVLPMLVLIIGFVSTCLKYVNRGPAWNHLMGLDYERCEKNGIWSLMFLSNYYKSDEMCLHQSWFVSAEMQLFVLGLVIIKLVSSIQKFAIDIFLFFIFSGFAVSYVDAYFNKLPITTRLYPEVIYSAFNSTNSWLHINITGHSQIPSFVQGLLCGYYYNKLKHQKKRFNVGIIIQIMIQGFLWILAIGTMCCTALFYQDGFQFELKDSTLYHTFSKYLFTLPISAGMFGALFGIGGFIKEIFSVKPFQIFGKATFSVFLVHMIVIKLRLGAMRSPIYLSHYTLVVDALGDATVSFILGSLVHVIFELPISGLVRAISERKLEDKGEKAKRK